MVSLRKHAKEYIHAVTAFIAGIMLFLALASFSFKAGIMNEGFHAKLFEKQDLYNRTYNFIKSSMNDFVNSVKNNSPADFEQHKDIFDLFQKSVTRQMIKSNLESMRKDTFLYLQGKRMFLPDIHLGEGMRESAGQLGIPGKESNGGKLSAQSISKIDKINLSAILLYINRSDITEYFFSLKFMYFVSDKLPGLLAIPLLMLLIGGIALSGSLKKISFWLCAMLSVSGCLLVFAGFALSIYNRFLISDSIRFVAMSLPADTDGVTNYFRSCLWHLALILFVCGLSSIILIPFVSFSCKLLAPASLNARILAGLPEKTLRILKGAVIITAFILLALTLSIRIYSISKDFKSNNYISVLQKINSSKYTAVISAKDDTIYSLEVRLVDSKDGVPVTNAPVNVSGKSDLLKKEFDKTEYTDSKGVAKYILDRGTFRLSFLPSSFPSSYQPPSPFFYELKTAGTTLLTVKVDKSPEKAMDKWGIAEIEVLDKDNNPIQGIQFTVDYPVFAHGDPDAVYSYSNQDGIAVFKLNEGVYTISATGLNFPNEYQLPSSIRVEIKQSSISRYTIRLSQIKTDR
ncbi:MAG: hypothetical protein N2489_02180 [Clostridia bacterium]|nr:hypothetical protein [Clostridia bacterium]